MSKKRTRRSVTGAAVGRRNGPSLMQLKQKAKKKIKKRENEREFSISRNL